MRNVRFFLLSLLFSERCLCLATMIMCLVLLYSICVYCGWQGASTSLCCISVRCYFSRRCLHLSCAHCSSHKVVQCKDSDIEWQVQLEVAASSSIPEVSSSLRFFIRVQVQNLSQLTKSERFGRLLTYPAQPYLRFVHQNVLKLQFSTANKNSSTFDVDVHHCNR